MAVFLIVEDDAVACGMMLEACHAVGHSAIAVTDPDTALAAIRAGGIDAAIIDWWLKPMPPGGGYTVAMAACDAGMAVAVVTGYPTNEFQTQSKALESRGCIMRLKPYHVMELIADLAAKTNRPRK